MPLEDRELPVPANSPRSQPDVACTYETLSLSRRVFLGVVLAGIVCGHLYCLLSNAEERWPFSRYAMYSQVRDPVQAAHYVLVGVRADDSSGEVEVFRNWEYMRPLYRGSVHWTVQQLLKVPESGSLLEAVAVDCLRRYEDRRRKGLHDGPELAAMRIYHYRWRYAELDLGDRRPTARELLAEVALHDAKK
jgi:hypothetical protein